MLYFLNHRKVVCYLEIYAGDMNRVRSLINVCIGVLTMYSSPAMLVGESLPKMTLLVKVLSPEVVFTVMPLSDFVTSSLGLAAHILAARSAGTPYWDMGFVKIWKTGIDE